MNSVLQDMEKFGKKTILPFLEKSKENVKYPEDIIAKMGEMGLFGINIPKEYKGSKLPISLNLEINRILSKYWLSILALYGTHLRCNQYFMEIGTKEQKDKYLPKMATGEYIVSHAFHEKSIKNPLDFSTYIEKKDGKFLLHGSKGWVTNANKSNFMIVVAKRVDKDSKECSAVIVRANQKGVSLKDDLNRRGVKGVSLQVVDFDNVIIEEKDFIGGSHICALSFVNQCRALTSLNFAARCVGVAESILELTRPYVLLSNRDEEAKGVIYYRWSQLEVLKESIVAYFEKSVLLKSEDKLTRAGAFRTKVFCSSQLEELLSLSRMLTGGTGFASDDEYLIRQLNDGLSLTLIDTPNDILLTWSGKEDLNGN